MFVIRTAEITELPLVRDFYHSLIDMMQGAEYRPLWEKDVYPSDAYLSDSVGMGQLYLGLLDGVPAAAMIVNQSSNDGYNGVQWSVDARAEEVTVIHALGVLPTFSRRGLAKEMVRFAVAQARAQHQQAVRLDVLAGNLPARALYSGLGFRYVTTVNMFYEDTGWTDFLLYEYPL